MASSVVTNLRLHSQTIRFVGATGVVLCEGQASGQQIDKNTVAISAMCTSQYNDSLAIIRHYLSFGGYVEFQLEKQVPVSAGQTVGVTITYVGQG